MSRQWSCDIDLRLEGGEVHAYCDDLPEAIPSAGTEAGARREMEALIAAVRGRMKDGTDSPMPRRSEPDRPSIALPVWPAVKASPYGAWRTSGLSEAELVERLDRLAEAAAALGARLSIRFEAA